MCFCSVLPFVRSVRVCVDCRVGGRPLKTYIALSSAAHDSDWLPEGRTVLPGHHWPLELQQDGGCWRARAMGLWTAAAAGGRG